MQRRHSAISKHRNLFSRIPPRFRSKEGHDCLMCFTCSYFTETRTIFYSAKNPFNEQTHLI